MFFHVKVDIFVLTALTSFYLINICYFFIMETDNSKIYMCTCAYAFEACHLSKTLESTPPRIFNAYGGVSALCSGVRLT